VTADRRTLGIIEMSIELGFSGFFPDFSRIKPMLLHEIVKPGKSYWRGRLSTVDLLVLTSLYWLIFFLKILFIGVSKQATLIRRSTVLSLPLQLGFPGEA
jgi:hypothetical protein